MFHRGPLRAIQGRIEAIGDALANARAGPCADCEAARFGAVSRAASGGRWREAAPYRCGSDGCDAAPSDHPMDRRRRSTRYDVANGGIAAEAKSNVSRFGCEPEGAAQVVFRVGSCSTPTMSWRFAHKPTDRSRFRCQASREFWKWSLHVADLPCAIAFYRGLFGFEQIEGDERFFAFDVVGPASAALVSRRRLRQWLDDLRRLHPAARWPWTIASGLLDCRNRLGRLAGAARRTGHPDREPSPLVVRRAKRLFPRSRRASCRTRNAGLLEDVLRLHRAETKQTSERPSSSRRPFAGAGGPSSFGKMSPGGAAAVLTNSRQAMPLTNAGILNVRGSMPECINSMTWRAVSPSASGGAAGAAKRCPFDAARIAAGRPARCRTRRSSSGRCGPKSSPSPRR